MSGSSILMPMLFASVATASGSAGQVVGPGPVESEGDSVPAATGVGLLEDTAATRCGSLAVLASREAATVTKATLQALMAMVRIACPLVMTLSRRVRGSRS